MCPAIMVSVILKGVISPREAHSVKRRDLIQEKEKGKKRKREEKEKEKKKKSRLRVGRTTIQSSCPY